MQTEVPVVMLFDGADGAARATELLAQNGVESAQVGTASMTAQREGEIAATGPLADVAPANGVAAALQHLGVPEAHARWYDEAVREGQRLVVVRANGRADQVRELLRQAGGKDVASQGGEHARARVHRGGEAPARLVTREWVDVVDRYENIWAQRYGAQGGSWAEYEPAYRYAWDFAQQPAYRGRDVQELETAARQGWLGSGGVPAWERVVDGMRDVWADLSEDWQHRAEGGEKNNVVKPQDYGQDLPNIPRHPRLETELRGGDFQDHPKGAQHQTGSP